MTWRDVNMLLWLEGLVGGFGLVARMSCKGIRESEQGDDAICWEGAIVVGCEWSLRSCLATVFHQGSFAFSSFVALTVNEHCLFFLRQCFITLGSSTATFPIGTPPKSPSCIKVSRYAYWAWPDVTWAGVWVGGEDVMQRHAWECVGTEEVVDGICWEWGDSSRLWVKITFFSCHSIISGFYRLLLLFALTANELSLLFLPQRFTGLPSSTVSLAIGMSRNSSSFIIVSRY